MTEYIKIPECTIYSAMSPYRVGLYSFLSTHRQHDNQVTFSITSLCEYLGVNPDYHEQKTNYILYNDLDMMSVFGYFNESPDFDFIKKNERGAKTLRTLTLSNSIFNPSGRFAIISIDEINAILAYHSEQKKLGNKFNISHTLLLLAYIRVNIHKSKNTPRCCYRLYSSIERDIDLSIYNVKRALSVLQELDIITVGDSGRSCKYDKETKKKYFTNPFKIFADSRTYLNSNGKLVVNKDYDPLKEIEAQRLIIQNSSQF